jgi:hypothetical protein
MRVLLDECVDQRLRLLVTEHDCQSAGYAKLAGLKNGALLVAAESAGFDLIITTDQKLPYQQNLLGRRISLLILCAPTNRLADLEYLVPAALQALKSIKVGQVIRIEAKIPE